MCKTVIPACFYTVLYRYNQDESFTIQLNTNGMSTSKEKVEVLSYELFG